MGIWLTHKGILVEELQLAGVVGGEKLRQHQPADFPASQ
jgi:hypothetical protein